MIQNNVIHQAYQSGVKKLMFLGSTCIYPRECPQPMKEEYLLTSPLEYTNEPYAIAKIAGIKMCESYNIQYDTNFLSVMPTNLYGPNDNFDLEKSHVLPALIRKIHLGKCLEENDWEAIRTDLNQRPIENIDGNATEQEITSTLEKYGIRTIVPSHSRTIEPAPSLSVTSSPRHPVTVEIWGSGKPMREFLWSEEMADACVFLMENVDFKDVIKGQKVEKSEKSKSPKVEKSKSQALDSSTLRPFDSSTSTSFYAFDGPSDIRNTHINIGTGKEISIKALAELVKKTVGFKGDLVFNTSKPDGTMRKLTDVTKLHELGWHHEIEIEEGVEKMYEWYRK